MRHVLPALGLALLVAPQTPPARAQMPRVAPSLASPPRPMLVRRGWPLGFHIDPDDPGRHIGRGHPLYGTSWLNRPWHADWFLGRMDADTLIAGQVGQDDTILGGYRVGRDWSHYWGSELQVAFGYPDSVGPSGEPLGPSGRLVTWDVRLLHYPWGDARWRPFLLWGLGVAELRFTDPSSGLGRREVLLHMPWGFGVKHFWRRWAVLRLDATDNLVFGNRGLERMHNLSLTVGVELHWGWPALRYQW